MMVILCFNVLILIFSFQVIWSNLNMENVLQELGYSPAVCKKLADEKVTRANP